MTLGSVLTAGIGLILVYLLLSLVATTVQETINTWMSKRGKVLEQGLRDLLKSGVSGELADAVLGHPLVQAGTGDHKPSYLPARNFSAALFDTLTQGKNAPTVAAIREAVTALPDGAAKTALLALLKEADDDMDRLQARVELWFDDAMDRVSGIYKRHAKGWTLTIGIALAIGLNVNTIEVGATLLKSAETQDAVNKVAASVAANTSPADVAGQALKIMQSLPLPIGWKGDQAILTQLDARFVVRATDSTVAVGSTLAAILIGMIGWLITGLAVCLGAPFWFDTLKNVMNVRGSGPVPPRADALPPANPR